MGQIISLERIRREAREAAQQGLDLEACCPYPLDSDAGGAFVWHFTRAQQEMREQSQEGVA